MLSLAVTVVEYVPAVVGVPEIRPDEALIDSPGGQAGRAVGQRARHRSQWPLICSDLAVPTVPVWLPGLVTVTVLPVPPWVTIAWLIAQLFVSFDHEACSA